MKVTRLLALSAALALAACSKTVTEKPADATASPAKPPLVTVNGKPISTQLFEDYAQALAHKPASELSQEDRDQIKENLVRIVLIAEQAEKDGVTKDPDVATRLELSRLNLLQQAAAQKYLKDHTPTDAELRAEFEAQMAASPLVEYHARHILVSSADLAQKVIDQLKGGADFANLAKRVSADKGSAAKGGDLDWFPPNAMGDQAFADAIALLKNGEYTKTPVHTKYGFHVIQLIATRDTPPPAFDDVKERLGQILVGKKFKTSSDEMLKAAKIEPPLATATVAAPAPAAPVSSPAPAPETK